MSSRIRSLRPSGAMIVAIVALVAAIGGTAYAATQIGSKQIKNNSVKSNDVRNNGLKGKDVKDDTLGGKQVDESKLGQVPSAASADSAKQADSAASAGNADTLGGETAADQKVRWLLLNEDGEIEDQSGGFTIVDAYQTNANVYIDAGESLAGKGFTASIAIQNLVDVDDADGDAEPNFAGEVSVTRCQIPNVVACAPPGAQNEDALVVSPRNSDGSATTTGARKRVYVQVTE